MNPLTTLVIGDSYGRRIANLTGVNAPNDDGDQSKGWPTLAGIPRSQQQAVSGTTAAQWAADLDGMLTNALNTITEDKITTVIISLLGNDAFAVESAGVSEAGFVDAIAGIVGYRKVLEKIGRPGLDIYAFLYGDPFNRQNLQFNEFLPVLRDAITLDVGDLVKGYVDCGALLGSPEDYNGSDIHPAAPGQLKIANFISTLL